MVIAIGSKNPIKVKTVRDTLRTYPRFEEASFISCRVDSGVGAQPWGQDVIDGAKNRALACDIPLMDVMVGVESGLREASLDSSKSILEFCAVVVVSKTNTEFGWAGASAPFPLPKPIAERVAQGDELAVAVEKCGWASASIREEDGLIGLLTDGRITRGDQIREALINAITPLVSPYYSPIDADTELVNAYSAQRRAFGEYRAAMERVRKLMERKVSQ